jgi:fatty acid desaturase
MRDYAAEGVDMSQTKRSHHGNTPAAWTAVIIVFVAFIVGGAGVWLGSSAMFWLGVILTAVGGLVGKLMQMAGYGQHRRS